jgi:hypothetical protein
VQGTAVNELVAIDLPRELDSARRAREALEPLRAATSEAEFVDLRILVSALVIEAIRALGPQSNEAVRLRVEHEEESVRASVEAQGDSYFVLPTPDESGNIGSSLFLLQRLSDRRGVRRDEDSTTAWLEIDLGASS